MDEEMQNGVGGGSAPDSLNSEASAASILDADPTLLRDMQKTMGPSVTGVTPTPPSAAAGKNASLWHKVKDWWMGGVKYGANQSVNVQQGLNDVTRGALKGIDNLSNTVRDVALGAEKAVGGRVAKALGKGDEFMQWYDHESQKVNPLQFGEDRIDRWYGPAQGGIHGFIEGASQFAVGMYAAGEVLKPVQAVKKLEEAGHLGKAAVGAVKGFMADASVFDPHQARLSNLITEHAPPAFQNAVTSFLANKEEDSAALGRVKNGLEGLLLGSVVEATVGGIRVMRARMKGAPAEEIGKIIDETRANVEAAKAQEPVQVAETADGKYEVRPNQDAAPAGDGAKVEAPAEEHPQFASLGAAQNYAASVNYAVNNTRLAKGSIDPTMVEQWRQAMQDMADGKDPRSAVQVLHDTGVNVNYVQSPEEVVSTVKALAGIAPDASTVARGKVKTWAETAQAAEGMFKDLSGDEVVQRAAKIFGTTDRLDEHVAAMRTWMWAHAQRVRDLSRFADLNPDNAIATDQLAASLDTMHEFHAYFTGTNANIARAFNVNKMPVGEAMADAASGEVKAGVSDAADHLGADVANPEASHQEAADELQAATTEAKQAVEDAKTNTTDTNAVNATDFSLARARQRVLSAMKKLNEGDTQFAHDPALAKQHAEEIKKLAEDQRANGSAADAATVAAANGVKTSTTNPIEEMSKLLDTADKQLSKSMEAKVVRLKEHKQLLPEEVSPVDTHVKEAKANEKVLKQGLAGEGDAGGATLGPSQTASNAGAAPYTDPYQLAELPGHRAPPGRTVTEGLTRPEIRALARMTFMADGDPAEMLAVIRGPRLSPPAAIAADPMARKHWFDYVISYRMEAMLSGPKTQIVNTVSNALAAAQRPLEYWWGGMRTGNEALKQQGADMLAGMWHSARESWSSAKKAFMDGRNILDPGNSQVEYKPDASLGVQWLDKIVHAPSRFLMSGDEFFKQLNYRTNVRAQILRQMRANGVTDAKTIAERLSEDMKFAFDPQGGAVNPVALQYARIGTFTNELEYGFGQKLQQLVQESPSMRLVAPFVRTPTNIFRYAWERTPGLNRFNKIMQEDLAAGGERAAIARAKTEMGLAIYTTAGMLAATGQITGGGPQDPDLRRQWKEAGNRPYSIKVPGTDRWVSFQRLDPTFAPLGMVADIVGMSGSLQDTDLTHVGYAVAASVMRNLTSKTYLQGITEFMDAMSSGRADVVENLTNSIATSFTPNVLRQLNPDDTVRETRGMLDEFMARVPGLSQTLEPKRNLFGEKVLLPPGYFNRSLNPFTSMEKPANQNVADELLKLGRAFNMPSETKANGLIDLTDRETYSDGKKQSPYDRMLQLMAHPNDGPSLRQAMEDLVQSDAYQSASEDQYINQGGLKWQLANDVVQSYQQQAWAQVLDEYPKLADALNQAAEENAASLTEGSSGVQAVLQKYGKELLAKPKRH